LPDPRDRAVDPVPDGDRDLKPLVEIAEPPELFVEARGERREVLDEAEDLVDQGRQRERQELDGQDDPDDVDDEDREGPPQASARASGPGIEEIDEQEPEDERADAVAGHQARAPPRSRRR
jgi:hypothetical protein